MRGRREGATVAEQEVGHQAEQNICVMADKFSVAIAIDLAKDALSDQRDRKPFHSGGNKKSTKVV